MENNTEEQARLLVHVRYAAAAMDECVHHLHEAVDRARSAGATWSQISEVLKTSEQEAEAEFSSAGRQGDSALRDVVTEGARVRHGSDPPIPHANSASLPAAGQRTVNKHQPGATAPTT